VIEGFTRIVREDYGQVLDRIGNDHLDRVLGAAARMNSMIDALLALARLSSQPLTRQRVDLSRMAQYVLDDLHKHAPQRQVETRVMPGLEVDGDPTLMRLVLENLLGNAWKYSSRRDVAHIEFGAEYRPKVAASQRPSDTPSATPLEQASQRVFYVSDDGAGFDMRFAERLFGAFQRLHSASEFQGTGVGLASVRRIVRRHGGEIWAEAEVDRGATFYFTLG
jgi:signal transduction histidine kinase